MNTKARPARSNRPSATRANTNQIERHIQNQRLYGEDMIGGIDRPKRIELIVSAAALVALAVWAAHHYGVIDRLSALLNISA